MVSSHQGEPILTVTAIDQDSGLNYAILYSIESEHQRVLCANTTTSGIFMDELEHHLLFASGSSSEPNPFSIAEDTGAITVKSDIDRETIGDSIVLSVKVG